MVDLLVRGGRVVTPAGVGDQDVAIHDGRIVALFRSDMTSCEARRVIDARGKIVVPGGVEAHAHIGGPREPERSGARAVSLAAIHGGTTTVLDFAPQVPGHDLLHAMQEAEDRWRGQAYTDYSFHAMFARGADEKCIGQIGDLIAGGFPSFKVFITSVRPGNPRDRHIDSGRLDAIMKEVAAHGGILMVHAEEDELVQYNYQRAMSKGEVEWWRMADVHSNLSEDLAIRRVVRLAEVRGAAVYFPHVSAAEGVAAIEAARTARLPVYGETLHNYLCFSSGNYREPNGMKYHTYPSLKSPQDQQALWDGVLHGSLSTVATDLVSTSWATKVRYKTIIDVTGGHNGIETRLGIVYTEGVVRRNMSLERFVEVTATNPAKIFGLYPRKGVIAVGSDADLAIIDPSVRKPLRPEDLHLEDYSIWEGWEVRGWPITTILRGHVMVEDGRLVGDVVGAQVPRALSPQVAQRPVC